MRFDVEAVSRALVDAAKAYTLKATAALSARIDGIEARIAAIPKGEDGKDGADGKDADPEVIRAMVAEAVAKAMESVRPEAVDYEKITATLKGMVELAAPDVEVVRSMAAEAVKPVVDSMGSVIEIAVKQAVEALPPPKDGRDGADGKDADPVDTEAIVSAVGKQVAERLDEAATKVETDVSERVERFLSAIPVPRDGRDADPVDVQAVSADLEQRMAGRFAEWALGYERKSDERHERHLAQLPKPKDGRDGLDLRNFDVWLDEDGRTVVLSLDDGERHIEKRLPFQVVLDRGVFKAGAEYQAGDGVRSDGSFWIARKNGVTSRPGSSESDWKMAVRKGRDGRSAYEIAKANGFDGTEAEWLKSLKK